MRAVFVLLQALSSEFTNALPPKANAPADTAAVPPAIWQSCDVDSSVYCPRFDLRHEIRYAGKPCDPTTTLLIRVDTIESQTKAYRVGASVCARARVCVCVCVCVCA